MIWSFVHECRLSNFNSYISHIKEIVIILNSFLNSMQNGMAKSFLDRTISTQIYNPYKTMWFVNIIKILYTCRGLAVIISIFMFIKFQEKWIVIRKRWEISSALYWNVVIKRKTNQNVKVVFPYSLFFVEFFVITF